MTEPARAYEVIVFGATGFTGGLTAEYLAKNAPTDLRWAIAGRNADKLRALRQRLAKLGGAATDIGVVEASVDDAASLSRMAAQTRVLLTTVGPFIDYGEGVVRACVEQGTDYVDSTGEPNFVELVIARYSQAAAERGVRLVSCCGLDSIPPDLGVYFTVAQLPADQPIRISGYLRMQGSFSGGTQRSAIKALATFGEKLERYVPRPRQGRKVAVLPGKVENKPELGGWVSPMPTIDPTIVVRSAATLDRYGPDFGYAHHAVHGSLFVMLAAGLFFGGLALLVRIPFLRELILGAVTRPGDGPSPERMAESWFKLRFVAECAGKSLQTEVSGGDPGYGETSKMLGESALCLVRDRASLPERAGALTPAEAMGDALLARLQRAGIVFHVV